MCIAESSNAILEYCVIAMNQKHIFGEIDSKMFQLFNNKKKLANH